MIDRYRSILAREHDSPYNWAVHSFNQILIMTVKNSTELEVTTIAMDSNSQQEWV